MHEREWQDGGAHRAESYLSKSITRNLITLKATLILKRGSPHATISRWSTTVLRAIVMLSWLKPSQKNAKDGEQATARNLDAPAAAAPASNIASDTAGSNRIVTDPKPKAVTLAVSKSEPAQAETPGPEKPAVTAAIPNAWEPKRRALTSAQSHPHDAVVAELRGQHPDHDTSARMDQVISAPLQSADTLPTAPSEAPGTVMPELDRLFDPHTGATLGTFTPPQMMANGQAREELWAHLARIRALQAEIAGLHVLRHHPS